MEVTSLYRAYTVVPPSPRTAAVGETDSVGTILPQSTQSVAPISASDPAATVRDGHMGHSGTKPGTDDLPPDPADSSRRQARFERDDATGTMVFKELDTATETVIVQFPDEQLLKLKSYIAEMHRREVASKASVPGANVAKTM